MRRPRVPVTKAAWRRSPDAPVLCAGEGRGTRGDGREELLQPTPGTGRGPSRGRKGPRGGCPGYAFGLGQRGRSCANKDRAAGLEGAAPTGRVRRLPRSSPPCAQGCRGRDGAGGSSLRRGVAGPPPFAIVGRMERLVAIVPCPCWGTAGPPLCPGRWPQCHQRGDHSPPLPGTPLGGAVGAAGWRRVLLPGFWGAGLATPGTADLQ